MKIRRQAENFFDLNVDGVNDPFRFDLKLISLADFGLDGLVDKVRDFLELDLFLIHRDNLRQYDCTL